MNLGNLRKRIRKEVTGQPINCYSGLLGLALTLTVLTCNVYGEGAQTINANLARHDGNWGESPQNSILCMQTYKPLATMTFDVIVPEPGGTYELSLSLVKVTKALRKPAKPIIFACFQKKSVNFTDCPIKTCGFPQSKSSF